MEALNLRRPIYRQTAAYGHFGRDESGFTWENTDKAAALRTAAGSRLRPAAPAGPGHAPLMHHPGPAGSFMPAPGLARSESGIRT